MAKRLSQSNTILNYFQSPKAKQIRKEKEEPVATQDDSDGDITPAKKRSRIRTINSDSDTENDETHTRTPKKPKIDKKVKSEESSSSKLKQFTFGRDSPKPSTSTKAETEDNKSKSKNQDEDAEDASSARWTHEALKFLQPDQIRDANKRRPDHPDYDPTTLYVAESYLDTLTPAMRQWWQLKSKHFDTVLFFKVGKFYELYHMDATVGVECLGFSYMKGEFAHSGFPESAYGRMASSLVAQGFKVARVEQTETPEMMAERCKKSKKTTKFDKVVNREICQVSTKGVCVADAQMLDAQEPKSCFMIAICEQDLQKTIQKRFGVCFIDVSIGVFHLADFDDDVHCSRLLTLMAQNNPALILLERGGIKNDTMAILASHMKDVKTEVLKKSSQFPAAAEAVIDDLRRACYFKDKEDKFEWPDIFNIILEDSYPKEEYTNCMKSLGACVWYLKKSLVDVHVLQLKKFEFYIPIDLGRSRSDKAMEYMLLDSVTLENLNLLGKDASLLKTMDYCCTAFGKRLFQMWICRPLCNVQSIEKRQAAVQELYENYDLLNSARKILAKLPDVERQIVKIHRFGNAYIARNHPDSRAILYEAKTYSKRKIKDLMSTLEAFETFSKFTEAFKHCKSRLLRKMTQLPPEGTFVDLQEHLKFFKSAFDHKLAKEEGIIVPEPGVDKEYDAAQKAIKAIEEELEDYLDDQRRFFKSDVKYFGTDKKRFQLEIPENKCHKVTSEYLLEGTKKGSKPSKRYSTNETRDMLARMLRAEGERAMIVKDLNRRIFEMFGERYEDWEKAFLSIAILDCLCCLAEYARLQNEDICIPKMSSFADDKPICRMTNARHPCISVDNSNFVPNDVHLGNDKQPIMILTGPNMGGKSTLMRQTVLIAIMAQMGSYVPASSCELSMVDRIFTRMGAQDYITKAQSTFLVELREAATILIHASKDSFVLLDELGRGTSTHDGNAIARAYLEELSRIQCRGIFATHYHSLVQKFDNDPSIQLGYMSCVLENEGKENERVIFLYKVSQGLWPKSYGFHVAALAGMRKSSVSEGRKFAQAMESKDLNRNLLDNIDNLDECFKLLSTDL